MTLRWGGGGGGRVYKERCLTLTLQSRQPDARPNDAVHEERGDGDADDVADVEIRGEEVVLVAREGELQAACQTQFGSGSP
jgi:hypothetical protein